MGDVSPYPEHYALKLVQSIAELRRQRAYAISLRAYHQNLKDHNAEEFAVSTSILRIASRTDKAAEQKKAIK